MSDKKVWFVLGAMTISMWVMSLFVSQNSLAGDWSMKGGDSLRSGASDETISVSQASMNPLFAPVEIEGKAISSVVASDGMVFVGTKKGVLHAFNAETGALVWQKQLQGGISGTPTVSFGTIVVGTEAGMMYGVNAQSSQTIFAINHGGRVLGSPAVQNDFIVFSRGEPFHDTVAYSMDEATLAHSAGIDAEMLWSFDTGQIAYATPAIYQDTVFTASDNGKYFILNLADGTLRAPPVTTQGSVFAEGPSILPLEGTTDVLMFCHPGDADELVYCYSFNTATSVVTLLWSADPMELSSEAQGSGGTQGSALSSNQKDDPSEENSELNVLVNAIAPLMQMAGDSKEGRERQLEYFEMMNGPINEELRAQVLKIFLEDDPAVNPSAPGSSESAQASALSTEEPEGYFYSADRRIATTPAVFVNESTSEYQLMTTSYEYGVSSWGGPQMTVHLMNPLTGNLIWRMKDNVNLQPSLIYPSPVVTRGQNTMLAVFAEGGLVSVIDLATNDTLAKQIVTGSVYSSPAVANGRIYAVSTTNAKSYLYGFATQSVPPTAPGVSSAGLSNGVSVNDTTPTFTWTAVEGAQSYVVEVSIDGEIEEFTVPAGATSFDYPAPIEADSYVRYRVRATSGSGAMSSWTSEQNFFVQKDVVAPVAASGVGAVAGSNGAIVTWTASPSSDVVGYEVALRQEGEAQGAYKGYGKVTSAQIPSLASNTGYTAYVRAIDRRGNVSSASEYYFVTLESDSVAPNIVKVSLHDSTGAGSIDTAMVTFSEPVRDYDLSIAGFALGGVQATAVNTGAQPNDETIAVRFSGVSGTEARNLTYAAAAGTVTDLSGNKASDLGANEVIESDEAAPAILSATAKENALVQTGIDGDDTIVIEFSEPTNAPTLTANNIDGFLSLSFGHSFLSADGSIGAITWSNGNRTLTIALSASGGAPTVASNDTIALGMNADMTISDVSENRNPSMTVRAIRGSFSEDADAPTVERAAVLDTDLNGRIDALQLIISEDVNTGSINPQAFTLGGVAGKSLYEPADTGSVAVIILDAEIPGTASAALSYSKSLGQIADASGNALESFSLSADEVVDAASPMMAGVVTTGDPISEVTISFTENIDPARVSLMDFNITAGTHQVNLVTLATGHAVSGNTLRITFSGATVGGTAHVAYSPLSGGSIRDASGNLMQQAGTGSIPVAVTDATITVVPGVIALDASKSYDQDGGKLSASWTQLSGPQTVTIESNGDLAGEFLARRSGRYVFGLVVSDGVYSSVQKTLTVNVQNVAPDASASFVREAMEAPAGFSGRYSPVRVTLSSARSTDMNSVVGYNDIVSARFKQISGPSIVTIDDSDFADARASFVTTSLSAGLYQFQLEVKDAEGIGDTEIFAIAISGADESLPMPNAGPDRFAVEGSIVSLSPRRSIDTDSEDELKFFWHGVSEVDEQLQTDASGTATFTPSAAGTYEFLLSAPGDVAGATSLPDSVRITVLPRNYSAPVAKASAPTEVSVGDQVNLDSSGSSFEGGAPSFAWTQVEGPEIDIENAGSAQAGFTPISAGVYTFELAMSVTPDSMGARAIVMTDRIGVVASDPSMPAPVVSLDSNLVIANAGDEISLSAEAASGGTFLWKQTAGIPVALRGSQGANVSFTPAAAGIYSFEVACAGGFSVGAPARVDVVVNSSASSVPTASSSVTSDRFAGEKVSVSFAGSEGAGSENLEYFLRQTSGPLAAVSSYNAPSMNFTPESAGTYGFELLVSNDKFDSVAHAFEIVVANREIAADKPALVVDATEAADAEKSDSRCFIVTATMKREGGAVTVENPAGVYTISEEDARDLSTIREFRDEYLKTNCVGMFVLNVYYSNSPALANAIEDSSVLRGVTRVLVVYPTLTISRIGTGSALSGSDVIGAGMLALYFAAFIFGSRRLVRVIRRK
ncbi:MAG: PQQ-binding-like beta-propeller repeat protein [Planctomycetes bacterium]|nr:PQQ-binding-like beta-propeller repeat protein [Planctomycetota bacterium]